MLLFIIIIIIIITAVLADYIPPLEFLQLTPDGFVVFQYIQPIVLPQDCYFTLFQIDRTDDSLNSQITIELNTLNVEFYVKTQEKIVRYEPRVKSVFRQSDLIQRFEPGAQVLLYIPPNADYRLLKVSRSTRLTFAAREHLRNLLRSKIQPRMKLFSKTILPVQLPPIFMKQINPKYNAYLASSFADQTNEPGLQLMIQEMFQDLVYAPGVPKSPIRSVQESAAFFPTLQLTRVSDDGILYSWGKRKQRTGIKLPQDVYLMLYVVPEEPYDRTDEIMMTFTYNGHCSSLANYVMQDDGFVESSPYLSGQTSKYELSNWEADHGTGASILLYIPAQCQLHLVKVKRRFSDLFDIQRIQFGNQQPLETTISATDQRWLIVDF